MKSYLDYNIPILNKSNLPTYPILDMKETLERFLEWVKPLVTVVEYNQARLIVKDFIDSDDSRKLDKKIQELGSRENDNWIFDYWIKFHLQVRDPLVPFTNVPIIYENSNIKDFTPTEKAAALIYGVAKTYCDFKENDKGDYYIGKKRYSTDQFHGALGSINHIQRDMDTYYINSGFSSNVAILYKNHIYSLEVINKENKVHNINEIYSSLEEIYSQNISPVFPNINFVTAQPDRDLAGDYLEEILKDSANNGNYQKLKDSIFVISLDEDKPETSVDELYCACMDTENFNRWHGKGLGFAISSNGVISFAVDHSFCDGGTEVYLINKINEFIKDISVTKGSKKLVYQELLFELQDQISLKLIKSFEDYKVKMNSFTARHIDLEGLTRETLKNKGILSGDGFIHIALQAAQMMTYDKIYNTYISVDARKFFRGRTESNRPVTAESVEFVEELLNPKGPTNKQKEKLLKALDAHYKRTTLCQAGKGVNRYLHVLEQVYLDYKDELEIKDRPLLFDNSAFKTIGHNKLSTTSFGHEDIKYLYFPPVTQGGFGIYYMVGDKSFIIITAFNEDVEVMDKFNKNLKKCIEKMLQVASAKI